LYTKFLWNDMAAYYMRMGAFEVLYSDNLNLGAGLAYKLSGSTRLNLGAAWTIWADETIGFQLGESVGLGANVDTRNRTFALAVGVDTSL
jgi:hypothetical protein